MTIFTLLADSLATGAQAVPGADEQLFSSLFMFGMIFVVFYFLIIRPQSKKFKQHQAMIASIKRNDKIITAGGIIAKVTKVSDNGELSVEIAKGVEVSVVASTVTSVTDHKSKVANDNNN